MRITVSLTIYLFIGAQEHSVLAPIPATSYTTGGPLKQGGTHRPSLNPCLNHDLAATPQTLDHLYWAERRYHVAPVSLDKTHVHRIAA